MLLSRTPFLRASAAISLALTLAGCGQEKTYFERELDLIVVSIDTLRADRMSSYGAKRDTDLAELEWSPAGLARRGTTWRTCWAPAGKTVPSLASFWTGLEPLEHGALQNGVRIQVETVAADFKRRGFTTLGRAANVQLRAEWSPGIEGYGFHRGFDDWGVCIKSDEPLVARELVERARGPIEAKEPLLIWGHFMAPHQPYEPATEHDLFSNPEGPPGDNRTLEVVHANPKRLDKPLKRHLIGLYDGEVRTASEYVHELLSGLDTHYREAGRGGLLENAVVVFFSDHGEGLGDHFAYFMHAKSLYSGVTRVPLIVAGPGWQAGHWNEQPIALNDVLSRVVWDIEPRREVFVASWMSDFFTARDDRWTLVHRPCDRYPDGPFEPPFRGNPGQEEVHPFPYPEVALFDRLADPKEQEDVSMRYPDETRRLLGELRRWYDALALSDALPEGIALSVSQLAELGYADAGASEVCEPWKPARWQGPER